jgi:conjugative relaxase-like TrwC/TraI family protein
MMRFSRRPIALESARDYYVNDMGREKETSEYYAEGLTVTGTWCGKGAEALGLAGDVSQEHFIAALQGIHPLSGQIIVEASTSNGKHVAGWDMSFSCPKSVSIQALVGGDRRLIEAHNRAVASTLPEIERYAMVHSRHTSTEQSGAQVELSQNLVVAKFNHFAARPASNGIPDPHVHSHLVTLNMTQRQSDGEWRALYTPELYRCQGIGTALYLSELSHEVQKLGYGIEKTEAYGAWELKGYNHDQVKGFSQRKTDIQNYMTEHGLKGSIASAAGNIGRLNTRAPKEHADSWTLEAGWRQRAAEYGIPLANHLQQAMKRGPSVPPVEAQRVQAAVEFAREHSTERDAVVDARKLEKLALEHGMARMRLNDIRTQIVEEEKRGRLIRAGDSSNISPPGYGHPSSGAHSWHPVGGAFTTDEMLRLEGENVEFVRGGVGKADPVADRRVVAPWTRTKGLLPDQAGVALQTLTSWDWITAIEGPAGSAKTRTVGAIREFAEERGYVVRGFAMTSGAVEALNNAGIHAQTIASLLSNPLPLPQTRELWFIDESSLLATRPVNALIKAARELGVGHAVLVGDQDQHTGVEAGAPVRQFMRENMMVAELTEIRRQRDPALRHAVEVGKKHPAEALALLEAQQRVTQIADAKSRYAQIALDFLRAHEAGQKAFVVSPGNDERRDLNQTIRKLMVAEGHIDKHARAHGILIDRNLTNTQHKHAGAFAEGDVVRFIKGAKGIARNSYLTVKSINWDDNTLVLFGRNGANISLNPANAKSLQVYRWEEREIAVGDRIEFRAHLKFRVNEKMREISNHALATIQKLDDQNVSFKLDSGRELTLPLSRFRHVDYGYASTSHAAQGSGISKVLINVDSLRSDQLVNQKQFYVSVSRGINDAHVYTDDIENLRRAITRNPEKEIALDAVQIHQAQQVRPQQQQPQQSQSIGMRI